MTILFLKFISIQASYKKLTESVPEMDCTPP